MLIQQNNNKKKTGKASVHPGMQACTYGQTATTAYVVKMVPAKLLIKFIILLILFDTLLAT